MVSRRGFAGNRTSLESLQKEFKNFRSTAQHAPESAHVYLGRRSLAPLVSLNAIRNGLEAAGHSFDGSIKQLNDGRREQLNYVSAEDLYPERGEPVIKAGPLLTAIHGARQYRSEYERMLTQSRLQVSGINYQPMQLAGEIEAVETVKVAINATVETAEGDMAEENQQLRTDFHLPARPLPTEVRIATLRGPQAVLLQPGFQADFLAGLEAAPHEVIMAPIELLTARK